MLTMYGIKNHDTIKKARHWLEAHQIAYQFHNYRTDGLNRTQLDTFIAELDWQALLNTRGTTWRKLDESLRNGIDNVNAATALMPEVPAITKRPLLCAPGRPILLGLSEASYQQFNEVQSTSCPVVELVQQFTRRPSPSPDGAGCQALMIERLHVIGFTIGLMDFDDTQNFWARRGHGETLTFADHTDVVPAGGTDRWINPPFEPTVRDGMLFGRGAADMKGSLAAMVVVVEHFVVQYPNHRGGLAFLITSDEEASAKNGVVKIVEALMARDERLDHCLVGEPSSTEVVGNVVKNGRRGPPTCNLTIHGVQGHVAYPHLVDNPIHRVAPMLAELINIEWDGGNESFLPASVQIASVQFGTGGNNVIPGDMFAQLSFRFSTELTDEMIKARVTSLPEKHQLRYSVEWWPSGQPFFTGRGKLVDAMVNAIEHYNEVKPQLLTNGGTSDGRFIARMGAQVIELGPVNATIHKISECMNAANLRLLARMYQRVMEQLVA